MSYGKMLPQARESFIRQEYTQSNFYARPPFYKVFAECKKQGKLLYGRDVLGDFGELYAAQRNESIIGRLRLTWILFLRNLLTKDKITDTLIRNYCCYKFTSYACGALISAKHGQEIFNKRKTLEHAASQLDASRKAHIKTVIRLMEQRFCGHLPHIVEDTYDFCMNTILDAVEAMPALPEYDEDTKALEYKNYDFVSFDFILSDAHARAIDMFVELVKRKYSQYIASVLISPLDLLHIEEHNICVFITLKKHIPFEVAESLITAITPSHPCPQELYLYIATPDIAISLNNRLDFNEKTFPSIFPLQLMSPTLLYLSTPSAVRYGEPLRYQASKKIIMNYFWHDLSGVIAREKAVIERLINDRHVVWASNIEFHHLFWQAIRLKLIEASIDTGKILIPLSSKQVCRRCNDLKGLDLPWLERFHGEFKKDLNGFPSDSEIYFSQALEILKELYTPQSGPVCAKK